MDYRSNLELILSEGKFAVTAEIGPPKGSDPNKIKDKAEIVKGCADAFNVTDNQTAVVRLSVTLNASAHPFTISALSFICSGNPATLPSMSDLSISEINFKSSNIRIQPISYPY